MKTIMMIGALIALALPLPSLAEDIDLFVGVPPGDDGKPNVLIILDNTANWNTAFINEKQALVDTFNNMDPNAFNVGLMMFGDSPDLGYVRAAIRPMSDVGPGGKTYNELYADMIESFDVSTGQGDGGNARTLARTFAEAYRYLQGDFSVEPSDNGTGRNDQRDFFENTEGTSASQIVHALPGYALDRSNVYSYNPPPEPGVCANTYVIYIGNTIPSGNVTKDNNSRNEKAKDDLETAATAMGISPSAATALITSGYAQSTAHQGNYADEWARFMHDNLDVIFYAIDVDPTEHPDYDGASGQGNGMGNSELIRSLSQGVGGGKYFRVDSQVGGGGEVADALGGVLSEIQAENSVFASVSLPADTTAQSRLLNQVFIGMFRPDAAALPRWPGNIKQYKLGRADGLSDIRLVDAKNELVINPVDGLVTECARSFWTDPLADNYWDFAPAGSCPPATALLPSTSNSPDGPHVEKGAQAFMLRAIDAGDRNVYTCGHPTTSCTAETSFSTGNGAISYDLLGVPEIERDATINWAIGYDLLDENGDSDFTDTRASVHGDVIHSEAVPLNYGNNINRSVVVYYGANDGMLRAVNGNQPDDEVTTDNIAGFEPGAEIWSFMPPEFYDEIKRLKTNTPAIRFPATGSAAGATGTPKAYGMDGPITAYEGANGVLTDQKYIYAGMRRGGRALYAFDVSDPGTPDLLWKRGCDDDGCSAPTGTNSWDDFGQTWSPASVAYTGGHTSPVLIMGGGYDACEDFDGGSGNANHLCTTADGTTGDHIYVIDAFTGALLKVFDTDRAVPASVTLVPITAPTNLNPTPNLAFVYAADTGGNVYRISTGVDDANLGGKAPSEWTITKIASFGCGADAVSSCTANRKFLFGPDVVRVKDTADQFRILLGSGDREKPLLAYSGAADVENYFFSFIDRPLDPDWLDDDVDATCGADVICRGRLLTVPEVIVEGATIDPALRGYEVQLAATEQVVTSSLVVGNTAIFSTHIPFEPSAPDPDNPDADVCVNKLGTATTYNINFRDAGGETFDVIGGGLNPSPVAGSVYIPRDGNEDEEWRMCTAADAPCSCGTPPCEEVLCTTAPCSCGTPPCWEPPIYTDVVSGGCGSRFDFCEPPGGDDFIQSKGRVYWHTVP